MNYNIGDYELEMPTASSANNNAIKYHSYLSTKLVVSIQM